MIAIAGGGPTGMALALALRKHGIASQIFDARSRDAGIADARILALSHGSQQSLAWLGVWPEIEATAIRTIHVSQRGGLGRTRITAEAESVPALGYVLKASSLIAALDKAVAAAHIPLHEHSPVSGAHADAEHIHFRAGETEHSAPLLAYAEGAIAGDDDVVSRDYGQHAVICSVSAEQAHEQRAWERFTSDGPLALLPLQGPRGHELAVVYTCAPADAATLAALDDSAFLARLQQHFGQRLHFTAVTSRHVFPLGLRYRSEPVAERQAWLGNAAQTLHPVAGQGYNLALRDVRDLARTLADGTDPGSAAILGRYARQRRLDRHSTIGFTDGLVRLFSNDHFLLQHLRGAGLLALDLFPPARSFVARRMMFGARAW
ncbi:MAG TPA: FAD-dependent monooxygenase [Rhodocyclaceae bacterium]